MAHVSIKATCSAPLQSQGVVSGVCAGKVLKPHGKQPRVLNRRVEIVYQVPWKRPGYLGAQWLVDTYQVLETGARR